MKRELINISLAVSAAVLYILYKKRNRKSFSSQPDSGNSEVSFILTNNTPVQQVVTLFNGYSTQLNPAVGIQANPDIQFFNASLAQEPKRVNTIQLSSTSKNQKIPQAIQSQITKPLTVVCSDANGNETRHSISSAPSPYQAQGNASIIKPDLILDGKCKIEYTIDPLTTVNMIMNYSTE